jgi:acetyl-CoA carboxylase biotin carboxyl carrier protein
MNIKEIKEMINLMNENGLVELEIEKDDMRIRLKRITSNPQELSGSVIIERQRISEELSKETKETPKEPQVKTIEIRAPMVGTFYRAPSPEAPPYVEVAQTIEPGQVICIIEAMKLMNEIKAEIRGKIIEILVENAEPVEFAQPMFLIEPL